MSNEIKEWRKGNAEPTPKDPRPVYFQDVEILRKEVNRLSAILEASVTTLDGEVEDNLATKVDKVVGKELSDNNFTNALMALTGAADIVVSPDLMPLKAFVQIPYGVGADVFTIEAVTSGPEGEDISVVFVNPDDISQALDVSYDAETYTVTVSHATDGTGVISTAAGNLVTALNTDVDTSAVILASMENAGDVTFVGTETLGGYVYGRVCKEGEIFSNGAFLFIALTATDGIANETTDFKKIALVDI